VKNAVLRLEFIVPKANEKVAFGATSDLLILARMRRLIGKSSRRIQVIYDIVGTAGGSYKVCFQLRRGMK
jgi:hypothetical protein